MTCGYARVQGAIDASRPGAVALLLTSSVDQAPLGPGAQFVTTRTGTARTQALVRQRAARTVSRATHRLLESRPRGAALLDVPQVDGSSASSLLIAISFAVLVGGPVLAFLGFLRFRSKGAEAASSQDQSSAHGTQRRTRGDSQDSDEEYEEEDEELDFFTDH